MNTLLGWITHAVPVHSCLLFDPSRGPSSLSEQHPILTTIELEPQSSRTFNTIDKLLVHIANIQDKQQLRFILQQHVKIFDTSKVTQANTPIQHTINTVDNLSISSWPYPRIIEQRCELQEEIQKMIQTNRIRPSTSPWLSPVILHKKKGLWYSLFSGLSQIKLGDQKGLFFFNRRLKNYYND